MPEKIDENFRSIRVCLEIISDPTEESFFKMGAIKHMKTLLSEIHKKTAFLNTEVSELEEEMYKNT